MENFVCKYCDRTIPVKNANPQRGTISAHLGKCIKYQEYIASILSYDFLINEYIDKGKSAKEIAEDIGIGAKAVITACTKHGLNTRTISESKCTPRCKEKYSNTNIKRYGSSHNMNRDHPARQRMINNLYKNYGVRNVFQRQDVLKKIDEWFKKAGSKNKRLPGGRYSKMHQHLSNFLYSQNIDFSNEFLIQTPSGRRRYYDIAIPHKKLLIEVHGDRIHGNPAFFKNNDIVKPFGHPYLVGGKWKDDTEKLLLAEENGWYVLYMWCSDIAKYGERYLEHVLSLDDMLLGFICRQSWGYLAGDLND